MKIELLQDQHEIERNVSCISAMGRISHYNGKTMKENLNSYSAEDHTNFIKKWYKNSSHKSLGDLGFLNFEISGCSIILAKFLEICRLAGYIEFSTRYVDYDSRSIEDKMYIPNFLFGNETIRKQYETIVLKHFNNYSDFKNNIEAIMINAGKKDEFDEKRVLDSARYYLPTSAKVGLGIACDIRSLENIMQKLWDFSVFSEMELAYYKFKEIIQSIDILKASINIEKIESTDPWQEIFNPKSRISKLLLQYFIDTTEDINKKNDRISIGMKLEEFGNVGLKDFVYFAEKDLNVPSNKQMLKQQILPCFYQNSALLNFDDFKLEVSPNYNIDYIKSITDNMKNYYSDFESIFNSQENGEYLNRDLELINYYVTANVDYGSYRDWSRHRMMNLISLPFPLHKFNILSNLGNTINLLIDSYYLSPYDSILSYSDAEYIKSIINKYVNLLYNRYNLFAEFSRNSNDIKAVAGIKIIELMMYTNNLAVNVSTEFGISLREASKMIQQRTQPAGHEAYRQFAFKLKDEILKSAAF